MEIWVVYKIILIIILIIEVIDQYIIQINTIDYWSNWLMHYTD